jgi:hypothetical protein
MEIIFVHFRSRSKRVRIVHSSSPSLQMRLRKRERIVGLSGEFHP